MEDHKNLLCPLKLTEEAVGVSAPLHVDALRLAGKQLLRRVNLHVIIERQRASKGFSTLLTSDGLVSAVGGRVPLEFTHLAEGLPTFLAGEGLVRAGHVHAHVDFQLTVLHEALAAHFAAERPLSRVDPQVALQVHAQLEAFPTHLAGEGSLSGVDPHVAL